MKQLLLVRHAKSSWANPGQADFDRPLNERGHGDAPMMANRMIERGVSIDMIISSKAVRALTTANYFATANGIAISDIVEHDFLYHAPPERFVKAIIQIPDEINTAAIFAHNPGITDFVNQLTSTRIDDMPTCAIFAIRIDTLSWKNWAKAKKEYWFADWPKQV
ncbi:histidine phosphatase family protein [Sediminibacterium sp.]|jgi:phosphohistidine phosphatase|uniref:SixA phosphatase family protein n=1 Tax=Sediminibacterium sp. TaxID=1917865 RepID=UPI0027262984|nr:histidine phosphatase family protein [Sediminibacterium sp.]MDO9157514.1 histidine phosphatase family protein [Sediminibacterium sp.]MDP2419799.1 histidine phosphatase family protein [Sediminibacterium sp.]